MVEDTGLKEYSLTPKEWIDIGVLAVRKEMVSLAKQGDWPKVEQGMKEVAYMMAKRGLLYQQFLAFRKEFVEELEADQPFAKTYLELAERGKGKQIQH